MSLFNVAKSCLSGSVSCLADKESYAYERDLDVKHGGQVPGTNAQSVSSLREYPAPVDLADNSVRRQGKVAAHSADACFNGGAAKRQNIPSASQWSHHLG